MTLEQKLENLINMAGMLSELTKLASDTSEYDGGIVVVSERNSAQTAKNANEIIEEHRVLSGVSYTTNHLAQQLIQELMTLHDEVAN